MTWDRLAASVDAGATSITLLNGQLDWPVGAQIVIATTGDRHSQRETETAIISAISADGMTLTLEAPLE